MKPILLCGLMFTVALLCSCAGMYDTRNCQDRSEELYWQLRKTTPYENIRMTVGRYRGHAHQWVEIWEGGKWEIDDPTLGNTTNRKDYTTSHHLGWDSVMKCEMPDKLKERNLLY